MIRSWLLRPVKRWLTQTIQIIGDKIMSAILDIANKVSADIDAKLIDVAAKDAEIADLKVQLAAAQANEADTLTAIDVLTAADAKIAPAVVIA